MARTVFLIRHAVPENDAGSFHISGFQRDMFGQEDRSLSETGRAQAHELGEALRKEGIELVLSSSMRRADETADIAARVAGIRRGPKLPDWIEIAPGAPRQPSPLARLGTWALQPRWSARLLGGLFGPLLGLYHLRAWMEGRAQGGEPLAAAEGRLLPAWESATALEPDRVAVVCHGFVIIWLARKLTGDWQFFVPPRMDNCSVTRFDRQGDDSWQLAYFARDRSELG